MQSPRRSGSSPPRPVGGSTGPIVTDATPPLGGKALLSAGWLVLSRFAGRLVDFFLLIMLARILVPADFGLVALAMTAISIVDIVLELPVTQALTRLPKVERDHLDTGFTIGVLRGLLILAVMVAVSWPLAALYNDPRLTELLLVLAIGPVARGLYNPAMVHFARVIDFRPAVVAEVAGKLYAACLAVSVAAAGYGYWALVAGSVASPVITTVVSYGLSPYLPRLSLRRLKDFAGFVGWLSAAQVIAAINWQFDRIVLGRILDRGTFGQFAMASDVAVLPTQSLVGPAMQPVMAAMARLVEDQTRLRTAFLKAALYTMLVSVPVCVGMALTADLAVRILFGPNWQLAGSFLQGLALTVMTIPYFQAVFSLALASNRAATVFRLNLFDLVLRIGLVALGVWYAGALGAIAARGALSIAIFVLCLFTVRRLVGASVTRQLANLWKVAAAAALMVATVLALRRGLALLEVGPLVELAACAVVGAATYGLVLWVLGVRLIVGGGRFEIVQNGWRPGGQGGGAGA